MPSTQPCNENNLLLQGNAAIKTIIEAANSLHLSTQALASAQLAYNQLQSSQVMRNVMMGLPSSGLVNKEGRSPIHCSADALLSFYLGEISTNQVLKPPQI